MPGVTKLIRGARGETRLGFLRAGFVVDGNALRYQGAFGGLVDLLEDAEDDRIRGLATFRGRALGRFEMRRIH
jgi:hypothetical protein